MTRTESSASQKRRKVAKGRRTRPRKQWRSRLRLWVEVDGNSALGPGRAELLEAIDHGHSLANAAKQLGMSYRQAWEHLQVMQDRLGMQVVDTKRGGRDGGGTGLTNDGRALLMAYKSFNEEVEREMERMFKSHFGEWAGTTGG